MGANSAVPRVRQRSGRMPAATGGQLLCDPPRVPVAEHHFGVQVGTRLALEEEGFVVCAEAADGPSTVEAARRELPDAAIVMPTVSDDEQHLFDGARAGACGYLLKDMDPDRLPAALSGVLSGKAAFPRRLVTRVTEPFSEHQRRRVPLPAGRRAELTGPESETLELLQAARRTSSRRAVSASARSRCAAPCPRP